MLKPQFLIPLVKVIKENDGISLCDIDKKLGIGMTSKTNYWLKQLKKDGVITENKDHLYYLTNDVFLKDGVAIVYCKKLKTFLIVSAEEVNEVQTQFY